MSSEVERTIRNGSERIGMLKGSAMTVSEALCIAEEMEHAAKAAARMLFGRDLALLILSREVRRLDINKA